MAFVTLPTGVDGGISQRAPERARPGSWTDLLNWIPDPDRGLVPRPPTVWRDLVHSSVAPEIMAAPIDLGGSDKYVLFLSCEDARIRFQNGSEAEVWTVTRDASGAITGGLAPDFTYLNLRTRQLLTQFETLQTSGGDWTLGQDGLDTAIDAGPANPLGVPTTSSDHYAVLRVDGVPSGVGEITQGVTANLFSGIRKISIYVNTDQTYTAAACDSIAIGLRDPTEGNLQSVIWGGLTTNTPTVTTNASDFVTFTEQVGTNDWRLGFIFDPDKVASPLSQSNTIQVELGIFDGSSSQVSGVNAWGVLLEFEGDKETLGPYLQPPEVLRTVQAIGTTFIANPLVATRLDTTVSSTTLQDVYGTTTFPGVGGGSDETSVDIADAGYLFVKQGAQAIDYMYRIVLTDTTGSGGTVTLTGTVTPGTTAGDEDTATIATSLTSDINTNANNTDGGTGGNEAQILLATVLGSVIKLETKEKDGETWTFDEIKTHDGLGDQAFFGFHNIVESLGEVPLTAQDDTRLILANPEGADGEQAIPQVIFRFEAEDSGSFGKGRWVEGTEYGIRTDFDSDTLPYRLVRRIDDSVGTVTGTSSQVFFEWAPVDWSSRIVGDDLTNAVPSFVTPEADEGLVDRYITGISFYKSRLSIASNYNVAWSEVGIEYNFWRTTIQALTDADRIDVSNASPMSAPITDMVESNEDLFLVTKRSVIKVSQGEVFGPGTVGLALAEYNDNSELASGVAAFNGFFLATDGQQNGRVRFLFPQTDEGLGSLPLSGDVPSLVASPVNRLEWAPRLSVLFVTTREDASVLYGLRFLTVRNQVAQASWFRLSFDQATVESVAAFEDALYLALRRDDGIHMESMSLDLDEQDSEGWVVRLDKRISELDLTTDRTLSGGDTVITTPYTIDSGADIQVVRRDSPFGVGLTVVSNTSATVTVDGDHTASELFIGYRYGCSAKPMRPVPADTDRGGRRNPIVSAWYTVNALRLALVNTAWLDVLVTDGAGVTLPSSSRSAPLINNEDTTDGITLDTRLSDESVVVDVLCAPQYVNVEIRNDDHKPTTIVGMGWEMEVVNPGGVLT